MKNSEEENLSQISLNVSRVLDKAGWWKMRQRLVSQVQLVEFVDIARKCNIKTQTAANGHRHNENFSKCSFPFQTIGGSQADGSRIEESDLDLIVNVPNVLVITDLKNYSHGRDQTLVLLMRQEGYRPCYPLVEVLSESIYERLYDLSSTSPVIQTILTCIDQKPGDKRKFLSSRKFLEATKIRVDKTIPPSGGSDYNGPCVGMVEGYDKFDMVFAIMCDQWPTVASEWATRNRKHKWPSEDLIKQVVGTNCSLVPLGDQFSPDKNCQWRISFTLGERILMWSINRQQFYCFLTLKRLIKLCVNPILPKSAAISSFMIKTTLFWYMENTNENVWTDENLFKCVNECLNELITYFSTGNMPHYFVRENNIIVGKLTAERPQLIQCLNSIKRHIQRYIHRVVGIECSHITCPICSGYQIYPLADSNADWLECFSHNNSPNYPHVEIESLFILASVEEIENILSHIQAKSLDLSKENTRIAKRHISRHLAIRCQTAFWNRNKYLSEGDKAEYLSITEQCYQNLIPGTPFNGHLLLGTYYWTQKLTEKLEILLISMNSKTDLQYNGECSEEIFLTIHPDEDEDDEDLSADLAEFYESIADITFYPSEAPIIHPIIACEFYHYHTIFIFPIVYFRFLEFLLALEIGDCTDRNLRLALLASSVEMTENGNFRDVAFNILGYCHMTLNNSEKALECFWQSNQHSSCMPSTATFHALVLIWNNLNAREVFRGFSHFVATMQAEDESRGNNLKRVRAMAAQVLT